MVKYSANIGGIVNIFILILFIGLFFSPIAALAAFIIAYKEYEHHFTGWKKPLMLALQDALFTFILFAAMSVMIGFIISRFI
ncbi:MAG: hypothetical protein WC527_07155 [Candidatus Margulisiibacteriota bacterium]